MKLRIATIVTLTSLAGLMTACDQSKQAPSQVLAKVNKDEITVYQMNYFAAKDPNLASTPEAKQALLDKLVDQELLVQKAQELKIDRDPRVLQALEQARSEILANSALERLAGNSSQPNDADVQKYYDSHPGIFAQRKVYQFDTFVVNGTALDQTTMAALNGSKNPAQTKSLLEAAKLTYQQGSMKLPAEQAVMRMGEAIFTQISHLQPGDILVLHDATHTDLMQLAAAESAPVEKSQVETYIKSAIVSEQRKASVDAQLASLHKQASISYLTRFAQPQAPSARAVADDAHVSEGMKAFQ